MGGGVFHSPPQLNFAYRHARWPGAQKQFIGDGAAAWGHFVADNASPHQFDGAGAHAGDGRDAGLESTQVLSSISGPACGVAYCH